jgi:NADH-quinone oxidoreductase B subunit
MLKKVTRWSRIKSPWILHLNSGACNACDIEIVDALTPRFDVERFGILLKATPRHADVIVASGPVTRQMRERIIRIYEQTPEPKFVIAVGACAMAGCVYRGAYNIMGGIDQVIPVHMYVPGCPARPDAIIDGVVKLLGKL